MSDLLLKYIKENDIEKVKELIISGEDVNEEDQYGSTPLIWASYKGHLEIVKLLLECVSDVNTKDKCEYTPLLWACHYEYIEIVKLLIDHGAKFNA